MSSNINPLGPMPELMAHLQEALRSISALPEVDARALAVSAAARFGIDADGIVAGNGTTEFIYALPGILGIRKALILGPTYADYEDACLRHGAEVHHLIGHATDAFIPNVSRIQFMAPCFDAVFICNPNNPTGTLIPKKEVESLLSDFPKTRFIIDESYLPFVEGGETQSLIPFNAPNRVVLYSLSKIFSIPGLRAGLMFFHSRLKKAVYRRLVPWSANTLSQSAVLFLMNHPELSQKFIEKSRRFLQKEKAWFLKQFDPIEEIRFFLSQTAFIIGRLAKRHEATRICSHLARHRILIRNCKNFLGLSDQYVRISIKTRPYNRKCARHMLDYLMKEGF